MLAKGQAHGFGLERKEFVFPAEGGAGGNGMTSCPSETRRGISSLEIFKKTWKEIFLEERKLKNKEKRNRPFEKKVRFNEVELSFLKRRIEESPFNNFQNYARILLLTGEIKVVDYSSLQRLNGEVNRIGNNINQLAKLAHQFDEISEEDILDLLEELREVKELVSQKFKEELKQERLV